MIRCLLIANRGEIAVRIIRACRELGIESVAVFSDADRRSPHVFLADRAVRIGPPPAMESYLAIPRVIDAAREAGADAVHPGYGFLAENPALAAACADAGLIFVGPPADVLARMGSKIEARALMASAGVPVVPGDTPADQSDAGLEAAAARAGYPVMIKASAGGGGIGMREVGQPAAFRQAAAAARREATAAFGDGTLYIERLIERPRHVEVQIVADAHGNLVHLFERDCSVQRRHQKIVEESPSPALTPALRERMAAAAVAAARAAGYVNAGTVEFLLEGSGDAARFYVLEVNARLQVEHPVTEEVTGVDLVRAQIEVASGGRLRWRQSDLTQRGHAIECRIYAEDPLQDFLPQAGRLLLYRAPSMPGVRVDSGVMEETEVPVYYDPLVAKLIASGETRDAALTRAAEALGSFGLLGVRTNLAFLIEILGHPRFRAGEADTGFLDREMAALRERLAAPPPPAAAAAAAVHDEGPSPASIGSPATDRDPWTRLRGWRV